MKVYGYFYNPCIHESADGLVSLHMTRNQADIAMAADKQSRYESWLETNNYFKEQESIFGEDEFGSMVDQEYIVPDWQVHSVQELEVEDV